ncbi:hypothetical protein OPQ81_004493 [Rhizoctonia solani]|nr:hypothetical protein OPQ81_004493 [Rhizoctonia solani]
MWNLMRTHDGFAIQYGEEDGVIDLYCGHKEPASALYISKLDTCNSASRRWNFVCKNDDVGGEIAETVEDRIAILGDQLQKKDVEIATKNAEIATKDRLLAQREQKEQELRELLERLGHHEALPNVVQAQLAEVRVKIEGLERLAEQPSSAPKQSAPKNVIEVLDFNQKRARSGRGYKIKNVKHGIYLVPHSSQPKHATAIGASPNRGLADWTFIRTHDGFSIQYGEEDMSIDLHHGLDKHGNPMHLWSVSPQDSAKRWKLERISDDVGCEVAETVEDRATNLRHQLQKKDIELATKDMEIAAKDRLLVQKEQELQDALRSRREVSPKVIQAQLAELRGKIAGLESLMKSPSGSEPPNNAA